MNNKEELPKDVLSILNGRRLEDLSMKVTYRNHKGEESVRNVLPLRVWYGSTKWHKEEQWLIEVYDLDRKAKRDYALHDWKGAPKN